MCNVPILHILDVIFLQEDELSKILLIEMLLNCQEFIGVSVAQSSPYIFKLKH